MDSESPWMVSLMDGESLDVSTSWMVSPMDVSPPWMMSLMDGEPLWMVSPHGW